MCCVRPLQVLHGDLKSKNVLLNGSHDIAKVRPVALLHVSGCVCPQPQHTHLAACRRHMKQHAAARRSRSARQVSHPVCIHSRKWLHIINIVTPLIRRYAMWGSRKCLKTAPATPTPKHVRS